MKKIMENEVVIKCNKCKILLTDDIIHFIPKPHGWKITCPVCRTTEEGKIDDFYPFEIRELYMDNFTAKEILLE